MEIAGPQSLVYFGPELALLVAAAVVGVLARFRRLDRSEIGELAILGASLSVFLAARLAGWGEVWIFGRALVVDGFAILFAMLVGVAAVAVLWISLESSPPASGDHGWSSAMILLTALGLDLMAAAANLWIAYLAVELASLGLWALSLAQSGEPPGGARRAGAVGASLAMLCGVAWLAGLSQSADYELVHAGLAGIGPAAGVPLAAAVAAVLLALPSRVLVAAWGRKDRASPALDAFVAVGFAAAGLAFSARILLPVLSTRGAAGRWIEQPGPDWTRVVAISAAAAMTVGNLGALREGSVRRLLLATAAAHVAYALLGVASATDAGLRAALFYVVASAVGALGAFHGAALVERARGNDALEAYRGLLRGSSWPVGLGLGVFLLSLAGFPGPVGFSAKRHVFETARGAFEGVAIVAALNIGLAAAAYGRVILRMLERDEGARAVRIRAYDACFMATLAAATIAFGLDQEPLLELAKRSIQLLPR